VIWRLAICYVNLCLNNTSVRKLGYGFDGPEFESRQEQRFFNFSKTSLVSAQLHIQWVPKFQLGREVDHSSPISAEFKDGYSCTSAPPVRLDGLHMDNFAFYLYILLLVK
jgi:hypothetical protein